MHCGIWVVTDSQILLLVIQHTSIIEQISFLSFFTLPFPLLEFIKEIMPGKHRMLSVMRKLFVFNLVLYLLNYISGCDMMIIILICEHLLMTVTLLRMIWNGVNENKKHKNLKLQQVRVEIEFADEQSDIPISVAMGYAWTDAEEKNLPELIHCADEKMYKDKKRIKENTSSA